MKLYATLISVVLWALLSPVETEPDIFYFEIAKPSVGVTELVGNIDKEEPKRVSGPRSDDKGFAVTLYMCIPTVQTSNRYEATCVLVEGTWEKNQIYSVTNFNSVSNLELPTNHVHKIKIDGKTIYLKLPQVLSIGVIPRAYYRPPLESTVADTINVKNQINTFFGRLVGFDVQFLEQFFAINVPAYFTDHKTETPILFDRYVTILQKMINIAMGSRKSHSSRNTEENTVPSRFKTWARSKSGNTSPSRQNTGSSSWSRLRSWSRSRSGFSSPSPSRSGYQSKSPSRSPIHPFAQLSSPAQHKSPLRQKPNPFNTESTISSPSRFRSGHHSSSDWGILQAAGLLALKMFDPCFIQSTANTDPKTAEQYCTTYCQFISVTINLYGQNVAEECAHLKKGSCVNRLCVCAPQGGAGNVKMVRCNNALRLHIYHRAAQNYSPKGFAKQTSHL